MTQWDIEKKHFMKSVKLTNDQLIMNVDSLMDGLFKKRRYNHFNIRLIWMFIRIYLCLLVFMLLANVIFLMNNWLLSSKNLDLMAIFNNVLVVLFLVGLLFITNIIDYIKNQRLKIKKKKYHLQLIRDIMNVPVVDVDENEYQYLGAYLNIRESSEYKLIFKLEQNRKYLFNAMINTDYKVNDLDRKIIDGFNSRHDGFTLSNVRDLLEVGSLFRSGIEYQNGLNDLQNRTEMMRRIREKNGIRNKQVKSNNKFIRDVIQAHRNELLKRGDIDVQ